ncbi:MAG: hypothetical protein BGO98_24245 [Myxococcales bacterium 68-20]|nr:MAG: hypothetical protein BGO98_24245 [Myxococcales bacterium 68-20]
MSSATLAASAWLPPSTTNLQGLAGWRFQDVNVYAVAAANANEECPETKLRTASGLSRSACVACGL